jgi:hypothetical protein
LHYLPGCLLSEVHVHKLGERFILGARGKKRERKNNFLQEDGTKNVIRFYVNAQQGGVDSVTVNINADLWAFT